MVNFRDHLLQQLSASLDDLRSHIADAGCCCGLKSIDFSDGNPAYDNPAFQCLYTLRYYGAYLCEYRRIYDQIIDFIDGDKIRVLSFGVGNGVDLAALYFEAQVRDIDLNSIRYIGYDIVRWEHVNKFVDIKGGYRYESFTNLPGNTHLVSVLFFPKSIADFDEIDFDKFISNLSSFDFDSRKIAIASSQRASRRALQYDSKRFRRVVDVFIEKGYITDDKIDNWWEHKDGETAWATAMPGFKIPDEVISFISKLTDYCPRYNKNRYHCSENCSGKLNRFPILKVGTVRYQLVRLEK